jgi:chromosome segregation ATPase
MDRLREHMRGHMAAMAEGLTDGNIVSLAKRRPQDVQILELVNKAADTIKAREERAALKERQALDVASRAVEQLAGAERQLRAMVDASHRSEARAIAAEQMVAGLDARAQHFEKMLRDAQSMIDVLRRQLMEAQARAETAEARATEANNKLADVSHAIRAKLMGPMESAGLRTAAAA